ncbi:MAG: aconitate hydratase AcnA [Polyangiaceae bacterium]|nr:aconitate hydratase AcnA [Polyangiaceae bacterium]
MDTFATRAVLDTGGRPLTYFSLPRLAQALGRDLSSLPFSLRILLENLLRHEDGHIVADRDIRALAQWDAQASPNAEIAFRPARVVLQDFTGVPALVDLAAMREAVRALGGDAARVNPLFPSELVIDHSVQVDAFGNAEAMRFNADRDYERNRERYALLRWSQNAFDNFRVVPPATGIVHQVNIEHLARVVFEADGMAYPDTLVGTDSHTTMVNGLGVLGWGVGGIEAEASMLGQPLSMLVPQVIGVRLSGALAEGVMATDLVLTITRLLRDRGVVGNFVEFFGDGVSSLPVADRATLSNMSPEYGSTCALFAIDHETLAYLRLTGRSSDQIRLIEAYARAQGLFRGDDDPPPTYTDVLELDLSSVAPTLAGPKRPHDRVRLVDARASWSGFIQQSRLESGARKVPVTLGDQVVEIGDGSVVIAAITSCTNTSNPSVMLCAGLLARNAVARGLQVKPWVKTSLAPGSKVVTRYLEEAGVMPALEALRFHVVGYGCTTCIGNSGPLPDPVSRAIHEHDLIAVSILSGNRNFEGRISPDVRANYLASPPLVVAYALAGRMDIDLTREPLGVGAGGDAVHLKDIWPSPHEIQSAVRRYVTPGMFSREYSEVFAGDDRWRALPVPAGTQYQWQPESTYVRKPPYFEALRLEPSPLEDIVGARVLARLGDMITTDHISPAGSIASGSPAARYLLEHGVEQRLFNSYGSRRGNHEVMIRGTFANVRLRNRIAPGIEGGVTRHWPDGEPMSIYDAAVKYAAESVPLLVIAGKDYGSGSSRDWAAKGTKLLGVRAVIAESFERIHRSNLVGMGVLPLQFVDGQTQEGLGLTGEETYSVLGIADQLRSGKRLAVRAIAPDGGITEFPVVARIDTALELDYYRHGGILERVLRQLVRA